MSDANPRSALLLWMPSKSHAGESGSSCGIVDVLTYEAHADVAFLQQEDLAMFGKLVFALCCSNLAAMNNLPKAVETLARHYSADLKSVALFLISKPGPHKVGGSELCVEWQLMRCTEYWTAIRHDWQ